MKSNLLSVAVAAALVGALGASSALTAEPVNAASPSSAAVSLVRQSVSPLNVWRPYDNANIASSGGCESRRKWLIANVDWIKVTNSRCQSFSVPQRPKPRTVWKVMVYVNFNPMNQMPEVQPANSRC